MLKNVVLVAAALVVSLPLMELAMRLADPASIRSEERTLFLSAVPHRDANGALRFPPNTGVHEVVVANGRIEYDVHYRTNNLGRVDHRDYVGRDQSAPAYVVVGDSDAMGVHGGEPWIPKLRDETNTRIYNYGMGAIGVAEFARLLNDAARYVAFTDIVVVGISDDFLRPLVDFHLQGQQVRVCIEAEARDACLARVPAIQLMDYATPTQTLIARAVEPRPAPPTNVDERWSRRALKHSKLFVFVSHFMDRPATSTKRSRRVDANLAALGEMKRAFPQQTMRFIHVPDRSEAAHGRYQMELRREIEELGVDYSPALDRCGFRPDLYHPRDNHLNAAGYLRLRTCVADLLGLRRSGP